jgi:hypothetical protein
MKFGSLFFVFVTMPPLLYHIIVFGIHGDLEIGKVIDGLLPKLEQHKLAHSIE